MKNMERNEFIAKLQMVYVGDINALNEIIGVYDNLKEENQRLKECCTDAYETGQEIIKDLEKENQRLNNVLNELEIIIQTCIYGIEPKGCSINFNCEYDSEEDYIRGIQTQERLNTYKFVLDQINELKESDK